MSYIELKDVSKIYKSGETTTKANDKVNFTIEKGEFVVILGPSGAGKSTTLNILGGIDQNDEGEVFVNGKNISKLDEKGLTDYRRYEIGFIFQNYNLIANLTALENVEMASQLVEDAIEPIEALDRVGLKNRASNFPSQLSGGEQQRVAIARALAKKPGILLCDEPTGALDYHTGKRILKELQETSRNSDTTVIIVTHNSAIKNTADRVIEFADSKVRNISINKNPVAIDNIEW